MAERQKRVEPAREGFITQQGNGVALFSSSTRSLAKTFTNREAALRYAEKHNIRLKAPRVLKTPRFTEDA